MAFKTLLEKIHRVIWHLASAMAHGAGGRSSPETGFELEFELLWEMTAGSHRLMSLSQSGSNSEAGDPEACRRIVLSEWTPRTTRRGR